MSVSGAEVRMVLAVVLFAGAAAAAMSLLVCRRARGRIRSLVCCGLVMLVGPAAAWTLADQDEPQLPPLGDADFVSMLKGLPPTVLWKIHDCPAFTDCGQPIKLKTAPDVVFKPENYRRLQFEMLERFGMTGTVTALPIGWRNSNCHGWIFTGGAFFVEPEDVPVILDENGYEPVLCPEPSDLAIYRDEAGGVLHTGIVRAGGASGLLVESKWGTCGVFLHPAQSHPYTSGTCTFYRSPRAGHVLKDLPEQSFVAAQD